MGKEGRMLYDGNISGFEAGCYVNEMPVTCRFTIHPQKHWTKEWSTATDSASMNISVNRIPHEFSVADPKKSLHKQKSY